MLDEIFLVRGQVKNNAEFLDELIALAQKYNLQIANGKGFDLHQLDAVWTPPLGVPDV